MVTPNPYSSCCVSTRGRGRDDLGEQGGGRSGVMDKWGWEIVVRHATCDDDDVCLFTACPLLSGLLRSDPIFDFFWVL
uniref:Uncharacterized protein n=1 Tax=Arundo donax TaxID=35708 RepID=A0A0A8Y0E0_ARUDO